MKTCVFQAFVTGSRRRWSIRLPNAHFSTEKVKPNPVFDIQLKQRHRNWSFNISNSTYYDYLREEVAERIVDRLDDINRNFPLALDVGCHRGQVYNFLKNRENLRGEGAAGGVKSVVLCDISPDIVSSLEKQKNELSNSLVSAFPMQCDPENMPFEDNSFDLVTSSLYLHWVNDLPGVLRKICSVLRPDGAFIGCMLGGNTLHELRECLYLAEQERLGGASVHMSPFASASDIAGLLQSAGFALPTVDIDNIKIGYPDALTLMEHLQYMGESSASFRKQTLSRDVLLSAAALYQELYGLPDGSVTATFQVIYMIGWSPHHSQAKPCQRGSATHSIADAIGHKHSQ